MEIKNRPNPNEAFPNPKIPSLCFIKNVRLLNPMSFIGDRKTTVAPHWYIRHGARDRDTAFPVPVNFATKLQNAGKNVNFLLAWNRPHSGDYALDELFEWIADIVKK